MAEKQATLQAAQASLSESSNTKMLLAVREAKEELREASRRAQLEPCVRVELPLTLGACKEHFNEMMDSCFHHLDILEPERMRDVSRMNYNPDPACR